MATKKAKSKAIKPKAAVKTTVVETKKTEVKKPLTAPKKFFAQKYNGSENLFDIFKSPKFIAALIIEIIGVFILTILFLTIGASPLYVLFGYVGIATITYAISGANLNPVITVGLAATRRISVIRAVFYILAQLVGAMLAYVVMKAFISGAPAADEMAALYGQTAPTLYSMVALPEGKAWFLFFAELLGSTIIALFFARALQYKRSVFTFAMTAGAGLFIALIFSFTVSGYVTGGFALNPALAIAMEAFTGKSDFWLMFAIYAATPLLGGIVGFYLSDLLTLSNEEKIEA